ncbi:hypothetical protein [Campylobacter jejuni]|uniref:hypothetical protein n=1 Tax=Campylobacter jejuni TaxID=197 RepID=UPI000A96ABF8|nr:hypothetical protein [Campylobacter jejuni]EIA9980998.1 hypothetical protein [Campylobacter jejuni]EIS7942989.1 hypothetical protein [Campylobacter jejuni]EJA4488994.1 hypothetical protein [Campylobacter jejuni]EJC9886444.1 hypothetical protein [Campylobacter jejuni]EJM9337373.1 hypothetical protein [Campylobacter jejuni]
MPRLADLLGFIKNKNKFDKITLFKWLISLGGKGAVFNDRKDFKYYFLVIENSKRAD